MFRLARKNKKGFILVFDEADALLGKRREENDAVNNSLCNGILREMDRLGNKDIHF